MYWSEVSILPIHSARVRNSCTDIYNSLAWAELYICFAHMFRRFEFENAGTTTETMTWTDYFVPYTKGHLMVTLKSASD